MKSAKQFFLLTLVACTGLLLAACEPSAAKAKLQPSLSSVTVSPATATVPIGGTQALTVTATFSDGSTQIVTSASSYTSPSPGSSRSTRPLPAAR